MAARLKRAAYGLNDAPRLWWNRLDKVLQSYGLVTARADRCCYVSYTTAQPAPTTWEANSTSSHHSTVATESYHSVSTEQADIEES